MSDRDRRERGRGRERERERAKRVERRIPAVCKGVCPPVFSISTSILDALTNMDIAALLTPLLAARCNTKKKRKKKKYQISKRTQYRR